MRRILNELKRNLAAGMLVLVPAGVSAWLVVFLWNAIDRPLRELFKDHNLAELSRLPGLGLVGALVLIFVLGLLTRTLFGRAFIHVGEAVVARVPIVGTVYSGLKQVMEAVLSGTSGAFREAVLIEYPRKGLWSVAFITAPADRAPAEVTGGDKDSIYCFVPTTPNPTSGYLLLLRRKDTVPLGMTVDEAVKLVISGGILQRPRDILANPEKTSAGLSDAFPESMGDEKGINH